MGGLCGKFKDHHELSAQAQAAMASKYDERDYEHFKPKDWDLEPPPPKKPSNATSLLVKLLKYTNRKGDIPRTVWAPFLQLVDVEVKVQEVSGGGIVAPKTVKTVQEAIIAKDMPVVARMVDTVHTFPSLFIIEIVNCGLKEMPRCLFEVDPLRVLRLSYNEITAMRDDLGRSGTPSQLHTISMDANRIEIVPPAAFFGKLHALERLNLAQNRLGLLPDDFVAGCKKLKYLDLGDNYLSSLPGTICECDALEVLIANSNSLQALPRGMSNLRQLRKLFVSNNKLLELPERLGDCSQLEKVRATHNGIRELPRTFVNLWQGRGGYLDELLLEGNPLVKPSITALELKGLDHAMKSFMETLQQEQAAELKAADKNLGQQLAVKEEDAESGHYWSEGSRKAPGGLKRERRGSQVSQASWDGSERPGGPGGRRLSRPSLQSSDQDAAPMSRQVSDDEGEAFPGEYYYFSNYDQRVVDQIRNAESSLLMVKKQLYVQHRVDRAKEAEMMLLQSSQLDGSHKELPKHLQKFLEVDFETARYTGKVRMTSLDISFALLVFSTKPLAPNCQVLFRQFDTMGNGYLTWDQWQAMFNRVPVTLTEDVQTTLWRLLSSSAAQRDERVVFETDFVAGWHLHDVEAKDPWIARVAKVLKMEYYNLTLPELQRKIEMGGTSRFQPHAIGVEDSSEEEEFIKEQEADVPHLLPSTQEGERLHRQAEAGGLHTSVTRTARPLRDKASGQGPMVSMSRQEFLLSRAGEEASDSSSGEESLADAQALLDDDDLSLSDSSWESADAKEWMHNEPEILEEEMDVGNDALQRGTEAMPQSQFDLQQLMAMPFTSWGRWRGPQKAAAEESAQQALPSPSAVKPVKAAKPKRGKGGKKDPRFKSDIFAVRISLREARRNMPEVEFHNLVNFLLRGMNIIHHYSHKPTYFHVCDPSFQSATGIGHMSPYVRKLLMEMGFVCINDQYWCWPFSHLGHDRTLNVWGNKLVPRECAGLLPDRLSDMIKLFRMLQNNQTSV